MPSKFETIVQTIITHFILIGPIIAILYLTHLSSKKRYLWLRSVLFGLVTFLFSSLFFLGVFIQNYYYILMSYPRVIKAFTAIYSFSPQTIAKFPSIGPSIWFPSLIALCILLVGVRRHVASFLPIQPTCSVHSLTLSLSMIIPIAFLVNVIIDTNHLSHPQSESGVILSVWTQDLFVAITAFFGVGWISKISFTECLRRLGLTRVSFKQIARGLLLGVFFSFCTILIQFLATHYGLIDPKVTQSTYNLLGPLFGSIFGVLTLGLAAAIGEETFFRGALLPRFGLLYSSILFALVHVHYGFSIQLFIVFVLGLALGIIRNRYNTTTSLIVHATYNITIGFLTYIAIHFGH